MFIVYTSNNWLITLLFVRIYFNKLIYYFYIDMNTNTDNSQKINNNIDSTGNISIYFIYLIIFIKNDFETLNIFYFSEI